MNSTSVKVGRNKRGEKLKKKFLDDPNLLVNNSFKNSDTISNPIKKERNKKFSYKREAFVSKEKKKPKKACLFMSNNTDDISVSSKGVGMIKTKKINIKNKFQRKDFNSEASVKEFKNIKHKKCNVSSPKLLREFSTSRIDVLKNRNKSLNVKTSVSSQKFQTESSDESDEDKKIRNELKSSSIYKNIQKLLKDNPLLPSFDFCEEECSETANSSCKSDEESIECLDESSSESSVEESKMLQRNFSASISSKNKKVKLVSKGGFESAQYNNRVSAEEEKAVAESETPACEFNRTLKTTLSHKDKKVISKNETPSLRQRTLEKLQGAKFRYLNEKLYTESGADSFNYFQKNTEEYMDYHKGYSLQVAKWPLNPVDKILNSLQKMKKNIVIADMGCGDAKIAQQLHNCSVYSFDLVALNDFVTPCNISKVPLANESVDVVVFCLSLMGTNLKDYLQEAYRIAKFGGILKIAEVESRIPNLDQFIKSIEALGFSMEKKDMEHKLFVFLEFKKIMKKKKRVIVQDIMLKPCLYKKR